MFMWTDDEYYFARETDPASSVVSFYAAESVAIILLLTGLYLAYDYLRPRPGAPPSSSLLGIIGSAVSDRALFKVAGLATLLYGILYAFASSILVYQPGVNFSDYGATGSASWAPFPCCGTVGTYPDVTFYFSTLHFAIQLVPLSLLLLFIVPPLVGLNLSIALFSVRRTVARATGRWMVACGAAVGLFTACPTCAGFFLAESVGGIGAATLAVALAPYQAFFIAVSIPLLLLMPFFFAARIRRAGVPLGQSGFQTVATPGASRLEAGNR